MREFVTGAACLAGLMAIAFPASARDVPESNCSWVLRTEDGRFTYRMQPGWTLQRAAANGEFDSLADDVVGATCLRNPPVLVASDAEFLRGGRSISLGGTGGNLLMITYEVVDGQITHRFVAGEVSGRLERQIAEGLASAQAALDSAAP